jgi:hypothetical protein
MKQSADHDLRSFLHPDEVIHAEARARDARLLVTDRRVMVAANGRAAMDLPVDQLRRIQFDIERTRPATLVIVPEEAGHEPQVLAIPHAQIRAVTEALALIGESLSDSR